MEIDINKIKQRFSEINEALEEIQKLTSLDPKEFWSEKRNIAALKYFLLQAIEAIGSICVHIAAKKFNKGISVFGEGFEILEKEGLLDEELSERLRKMVKFRNKLVHRYWEIDDDLVFKYAKEDIKDFIDFMRAIEKIF